MFKDESIEREHSRSHVDFDSESIELSSSASIEDQAEGKHDEEEDNIAVKENRIICCLRTVSFTLSVVACIVICFIVFRFTSTKEEEDFEAGFATQAMQLLTSLGTHLELQIGALELLALEYTSFANNLNLDFPEVTLPGFAHKAESFRDLTASLALAVLPLVTMENRRSWEEYAEQFENQEWIDMGLQVENRTGPLLRNRKLRLLSQRQGQIQNKHFNHDEAATGLRRMQEDNAPLFRNGVSVDIFHIKEIINEGISLKFPQIDESGGPYFPMWQHSPVAPGIVNYNMISQQELTSSMQACIESEQALLGLAADLTESSFWAQTALELWGGDAENSGPFNFLWFPIFNTLDTTTSPKEMVGMLTAVSYWMHFFQDILSEEAKGIKILIENECGQTVSYVANGPNITFSGYGDLHDDAFDYLKVSTSVSVERKGVQFNTDFCPYTVTISPSEQTREYYITNRPKLYTLIVVIIFLFGFAIFVSYDVAVELRQRRVLKTAKENRAVVANLFPAAVRERMFNTAKNKGNGDLVEGFELPEGMIGAIMQGAGIEQSKENDDTAAPGAPHEQKDTSTRIRNFLTENEDKKKKDEKPIADLFQNTTVLFADIAGFTAWSSQREPTQVFTLLQTVYGAFDKLAKKLGVFKVETIGDCYVAVTGLPDPQHDHAIRMARFARECVYRMQDLVNKLEITLGPDTAELCMRVGLHSGPVTAGVLRGEKSRFQLFGDTVNTAARMESTGIKRQIQCSTSTAELLYAGGKGAWLNERKDKVIAKGKGEMKTFWILARSWMHSSHGDDGSDRSANGEMDETETGGISRQSSLGSVRNDEEDMKRVAQEGPQELSRAKSNRSKRRLTVDDERRTRLVSWHVDMLSRLLKVVVAHRKATGKPQPQTHPQWKWSGRRAAEDVAEFIKFPQPDPNIPYINPELIQIPEDAMTQLKDFVTKISSMYRLNAFHNFEHASHMTMCTNKYFNRILTSKTSEDLDILAYTSKITANPLTRFGVVFASVIHDIDHSGISNLDHIKKNSDLVRIYGAKSMAEQNSLDVAWELLMDPSYEALQKCIYQDEEELEFFRQVVVNMVLATDLFDKEARESRQRRWDQAFGEKENTLSGDDLHNLRATVVLEYITQASDIGHTMQHWQIFSTWNEKLFQEMILAFQSDKSDRDPSAGWFEGELMFFDLYVLPLAKKLLDSGAFGIVANEYLDYAVQNRAEWAVKGGERVKDMVSKFSGMTSTA